MDNTATFYPYPFGIFKLKIISTSDCHIHSTYSDGTGSISEIAKTAVERGLHSITITDHMPLPFKACYAMDRDRINAYRDEIESVRNDYAGALEIKMGLEIEYVPELEPWIYSLIAAGWDHLIASVHCLYVDNRVYGINGTLDSFNYTLSSLFNGDMAALCRCYYQTIEKAVNRGWFDILGHLDVVKKFNKNRILFDESDPWYRELILQNLEAIKTHNMMMEINMSGYNHPVGESYPSRWIIREALETNIPLVMSSDAHKADSVGQHFHMVSDLI